MAEKYEFDFPHFDVNNREQYSPVELVKFAEDYIASGRTDSVPFVSDVIAYYKKNNILTDSQQYYLANTIKHFMPDYIEYEQKFFAWYNSRPDIQEIYRYGMEHGNVYVRHPDKNQWTYKGGDGWDTAWEAAPDSAEMFWRVTSNWNVRKFKAVNAPTSFEEGDLVVLRAPFAGHSSYDPLYTGRISTPGKDEQRIGTVMQMTKEVHRHSRAGNGSRLVNVLWVGKTEVMGVPERTIKHYERKRRKK